MKNLRPTGIAVVAALVLSVGASACGGSGSATATRPPQLNQGDQSFLAFTRCMRRHGVHMRDPFHRAGHSGLSLDLPAKVPAAVRGYAACGHIIASVVAMKEANMAARQHAMSYRQASVRHLGLLHYAQCMRAHGIPMLDPDANGNLDLGSVPGIAAVGRYTPVFRRADHACRTLLPPGLGDNGTGP